MHLHMQVCKCITIRSLVITIVLAQVDHIKWLLLYIYIILNVLCVF
jgi:hypothetical protein